MDMIGRYRITESLGSGSFATVFRGQDDTLDVPVAVKVLAEIWVTNDDVRSRFLSEARLLRRISDERIVRVYDIGTTDRGQPYFVMDLANGGSFDDLRLGLVAPGLALRLCAEAARALEVLHRHELVHRDVTPGNILLSNTPDGTRVMLAGLGAAKSFGDEQADTMMAGTPAYLSPEQAAGGRPDPRSDIFSMAGVTYALLTGEPPFPIRTLAELVGRNVWLTPPPVASRVGAAPQLDELLAAALSEDPAQRPQTALDFAQALDRLADFLPGGDEYQPRPLADAPTPPEPDPVVAIAAASPTEPAVLPSVKDLSPMAEAVARQRSVWFHVWVTGSAIVLLALTVWLLAYVLTH